MLAPPPRRLVLAALAFVLVHRRSGGARAAAPSIDLTSQSDIARASVAAVKWMTYYYTSPALDGAWDQDLIQWHESGEFWHASTLLLYRQWAGANDTSLDELINSQMLRATFWEQGDFLDDGGGSGSIYLGKWNDDIGWWGTAAATAGELYGALTPIHDPSSSSPTGKPWSYVASTTFSHMLEQWDSQCGGGIYWSRNRGDSDLTRKFYKSTITNAEAVHLAARLYALGGGVGGGSARNETWSYNSGELISGLTVFHQTTGNLSYLTEATSHVTYALSAFVNASNSVIWDPACDYNGGNTICKEPSGYPWALYRGLGTYYRAAAAAGVDAAGRRRIEEVMRATAKVVLGRCDERWYCIRDLNPVPKQYTFPNGTNPRDQIEAMEILNTLAKLTWPTGSGAATASNATTGAAATATTRSDSRRRAGGAGPWWRDCIVAGSVAALAAVAASLSWVGGAW
ncbi:glycosyl hydrolase family 76-domain-containing protein [Zopfochytrium polystomum]|nr:glycosyl hydrolase family 76-domain-containing protein [Zopfochytrium polystomum]